MSVRLDTGVLSGSLVHLEPLTMQVSRAPGETGMPRDSAMYSVIASEWPGVERTLKTRLAAGAEAR